MRKVSIAIISFLLSFLICIIYAQKESTDKEVIAVVTKTTGRLQLLPEGKIKWIVAKEGQFLYEGDKIRTASKSMAALVLINGVEIKINKNTVIIIGSLKKLIRELNIKLNSGQIRTKILSPRAMKLKINTDIATVSVRGTDFDMKIRRKLLVRVYEGELEIENMFGKVLLEAGEQSSVSKWQAPEKPKKIVKTDTWQNMIKIPAKKSLEITVETKNGQKKKIKLKFERME